MWVYRITNQYSNVEFTRSQDQVRRILENPRQSTIEFPMDNTHTIRQAWDEARKLWEAIGWDGHDVRGEARIFTVPGLAGFSLGFVIETSDYVTYLASPFPMPHIAEHVAWNATTDSEETQRARDAISDAKVVPFRKPPVWARSSKNNLTTEYENCRITIFKDHDNGYKAVLSFGEKLRTFTPPQRTEVAAVAYVIKHYDTLKRELSSETLGDEDEW